MGSLLERAAAVVRRRPTRLYLYGLLGPGFLVATSYGLIAADRAALWISFGGAVLLVGGAELAQRKTTPLADPRDNLGRELTPAPADNEEW